MATDIYLASADDYVSISCFFGYRENAPEPSEKRNLLCPFHTIFRVWSITITIATD